MNKKIIPFIIILLTISYNSKAKDYFKYYTYIYKAETCILSSNFTYALHYYDTAFSNATIPWASDYHNACLTAIQSKNSKKTFEYLNAMLQKGVSLEYFDTIYNKNLINTNDWQLFIEKAKKDIPGIAKKKQKDILKELIRRKDLDQYYREKMLLGIEEYADSFYMTVFENIDYLVQQINTDGFPNENMYGLPEGDPSAYGPLPVQIIHFTTQQMFYANNKDSIVSKLYKEKKEAYLKRINYFKEYEIADYFLISELRKQIIKGAFEIELYSNISDWQLRTYYGSKFYKEYSESGSFKWLFSKEKDLELMEKYAELRKKIRDNKSKHLNNYILGKHKLEYPKFFMQAPQYFIFQ